MCVCIYLCLSMFPQGDLKLFFNSLHLQLGVAISRSCSERVRAHTSIYSLFTFITNYSSRQTTEMNILSVVADGLEVASS